MSQVKEKRKKNKEVKIFSSESGESLEIFTQGVSWDRRKNTLIFKERITFVMNKEWRAKERGEEKGLRWVRGLFKIDDDADDDDYDDEEEVLDSCKRK